IPLLHPLLLEHVGKLTYPFVQLPIGDMFRRVFGVVGLKKNGGLVTPDPQMPVDTILGYIELAPGEPFYFGFIKVPLQDGIPSLSPLKVLFGHFLPKGLGIPYGFAVDMEILLQCFDMVITHGKRLCYKSSLKIGKRRQFSSPDQWSNAFPASDGIRMSSTISCTSKGGGGVTRDTRMATTKFNNIPKVPNPSGEMPHHQWASVEVSGDPIQPN